MIVSGQGMYGAACPARATPVAGDARFCIPMLVGLPLIRPLSNAYDNALERIFKRWIAMAGQGACQHSGGAPVPFQPPSGPGPVPGTARASAA